jgi:hypothetical protein
VLGHQGGQRLDVVRRHLHHIGHERAEILAVRRDALRAGAAVGDPVVSASARDDELALCLTSLNVGDAGQLHGRVDGLGPRAAEEHPGVVHGGDVAQFVGQLLGRFVGERVEAAVRAQLGGLGADGLGHLGPAVADGAVPQAGHAVDQLVAVCVPQQCAVAAHDAHEGLPGGLGERMQEGGERGLWHGPAT